MQVWVEAKKSLSPGQDVTRYSTGAVQWRAAGRFAMLAPQSGAALA
jgi:hypothetical protein